ncbi:MAG: phosphoadenylyl-sulfate reductase [Nitrospiraceae bacterium]|nr:phosphoadenylyl-sulfate reductase [Nitrospiraceae bacterium]
MTTVTSETTLNEVAHLEPEEMLVWAYETHGPRAGIVTSFQNTGCVMIDMAHRVAPDMRILTIDTLRLHSETYELIEEVEARYGVQIERFQPDPERLEQMIGQHGEFLFFDNKVKQEYCCQVRKVEPNRRALETLDVWITGLRRDQSPARSNVARAEPVHRDDRELVRLCPLADWNEDQVNAYIAAHNVPMNKLYAEGYSSIGCEICSTPILPTEEKRAGRWRWFNQLEEEHSKECGIHTEGGGI